MLSERLVVVTESDGADHEACLRQFTPRQLWLHTTNVLVNQVMCQRFLMCFSLCMVNRNVKSQCFRKGSIAGLEVDKGAGTDLVYFYTMNLQMQLVYITSPLVSCYVKVLDDRRARLNVSQ